MEAGSHQRRSTAFVREVILPGIGPSERPTVDRSRCGFALEVRPSPIHRWGVFAVEPIPPGSFVIEYTGERIDSAEACRRSFRDNLYLFSIDEEYSIDGGIGGSGAEFINHSCDPNLVAEIVDERIFLTSSRPIKLNEELTLDYELDSLTPITCVCGSANCTGSIA
jgi:SET domain-containing protein